MRKNILVTKGNEAIINAFSKQFPVEVYKKMSHEPKTLATGYSPNHFRALTTSYGI